MRDSIQTIVMAVFASSGFWAFVQYLINRHDGTKKELREQRILEGSDVLRADFNKSYFTKIDTRVDKEIKLYSKSAKLLTTHPAGSYNLVKDKQDQYELHITNPTQFWSVSKYLVVQVK